MSEPGALTRAVLHLIPMIRLSWLPNRELFWSGWSENLLEIEITTAGGKKRWPPTPSGTTGRL